MMYYLMILCANIIIIFILLSPHSPGCVTITTKECHQVELLSTPHNTNNILKYQRQCYPRAQVTSW